MGNSGKYVLGEGVSFSKWKSSLQAKLARRNVLGHVFHEIEEIEPALAPLPPQMTAEQRPEEYQAKFSSYQLARTTWKLGEIEARNIIIDRLSDNVCPRTYEKFTAKQLYDSVAKTRQESATAPYVQALEKFLGTRFESSADDYCDQFLANLQSVNSAAEALISNEVTTGDGNSEYSIPQGQAAAIFLLKTKGIPWLDIWRDTKALKNDNKFASLELMMSSLRSVEGNRTQTHQKVFAVTEVSDSDHCDPNSRCRLCRHKHLNKECFRQHPELISKKNERDRRNGRRKSKSNSKSKGKARALAVDSSDSEGSSDYDGSVSEGKSRCGKASIARVCKTQRSNKIPSLYDTGASHHFSPIECNFINLMKRSRPFNFDQAVGSMALTHQGTALLKIGSLKLTLKDTLLSPKSTCNIISAGRLQRMENITADMDRGLLVKKIEDHPDRPIARLVPKDDVMYIHPLDDSKVGNLIAPSVAKIPKTTSAQRWHQRLGHPGQNILKKTADCSYGLEGIDMNDLITCETCHVSKAQRFVSREPRPTPNDPLDEVFVDTVGKLTSSINGQQYAVILTDAKTRLRWVLTTDTKDKIASSLVQWVKNQEHQYGKRVRTIFRDGGTEFSRTKSYCEQYGIRTDISAPDTPEQNGVSEAANKVILTKARSLLIDAQMQACYWPWAVEHACYISNRLYCHKTKKVPLIDFLEGLRQPHREKIDLRGLPRFGCRAYKVITPKPGKFEPRAELGWFIGFQRNTNKNFLIYHPHWTPVHGWKWLISYTPHATFNEDVMFGDKLEPLSQQMTTSYWNQKDSIFSRSKPSSNMPIPPSPHENVATRTDQTCQEFEGENHSSGFSSKNQPAAPENKPPEVPSIPSTPNFQFNGTELMESSFIESSEHPNQPSSPTRSQITQSDGEALENQEVSEYSEDENYIQDWNRQEIQNTVHVPGDQGGIISTTENEDTPYDKVMTGWDPIPQIAGKKRQHSPEVETFRTRSGREVKKIDYHGLHHGKSAHKLTDPKTWEEAMTSPEAMKWKQAATKEFRSLKEKGAIQIIKRSEIPKGRTPMKCKWIFKKKYLSDGSVDKWKARCTAKGFTQRFGIDYQETFAPTPRPETGRILLVLAHQLGWHRRQGDVPTAFLNPNLKIDLYMELPKGFEREGHIIRLRKGLYGLKQAAALWYDHAKATLGHLGLYPTTSDVCLYTSKKKDIFVLLHVDDFQMMGPNLRKINDVMCALFKRYKLKTVKTDLFLGIHIYQPSKNTLRLSQGQYARTLVERHGLKDCKPAKTPIERLLEPNSAQCSSQLKAEYNSVVGGLQYLANNTRPDISFAVNHLARFLNNPSEEHFQAARRVLRYIARNPDHGITFSKKKGKPILDAYTDADFANDPSTSRSTSGMLIRLASGPISWKSHLQKEVVLSSTEAEYLAATETCRQLKWVRSLFKELEVANQIEGTKRTKLFVDNQSTISLIKNHDNHRRSKHIALRNFYCRMQYQKGRIDVIYTPTTEQLADSLTKIKSCVVIQPH